MTEPAIDSCVCPAEGKLGAAVIEPGAVPLRSGMTDGAVLWVTHRVSGIVCLVVVVDVTGNACARGGSVCAGGVANPAFDRRMRSREREFCGVVVELGALPLHARMAAGAIQRKSGGRMIRIARLVKVSDVTGRAGRGRACIVAVGVAGRTRDRCMRLA